jgi:hypothetical protein
VASSGKVRRIARSILSYIAQNPGAKDSLEGVRWWIERADECSDLDIEDAVRILLERGLISRWEAVPGSVVFGLSREFMAHPEEALHKFDAMGEE